MDYFLLAQLLGLPAAAGFAFPLLAQQLGLPAAVGFALAAFAAANGHSDVPAKGQYAPLAAHAVLLHVAGSQLLAPH
jgi:hypothetical protein